MGWFSWSSERVLAVYTIDASCGSSLFSRLFAKSGLFSLMIALDYSENMLRQCHEFIKQEDNFPQRRVNISQS